MDNNDKCVWLISFGDLLTLLLCFFLFIISMTPLNPHVKPDKITVTLDKDSKNPEAGENQGVTPGDGTRIAQYSDSADPQATGSGELRLTFAVADFEAGGESLNEEAAGRAKDLSRTIDYGRMHFEIETCSDRLNEVQSSFWEIAKRRAVAIKSQVIDAMPEERVAGFSLRVMGSDCAALRESGADADRIAGLRIFREKLNG